MSSVTRVASRWLAAKSPSSGQAAIRYSQLRLALAAFEEKLGTPPPASANWLEVGRHEIALKRLYNTMRNYAGELVPWIVQTRSIPPGAAKKVEVALRTVQVQPRNPAVAWTKNKRHFDLVLATEGWPERGASTEETAAESGSEVFQVGPFEIHNTMRLEGKALTQVRERVALATKALARVGAPLNRVAYGPVFIVGRLKQPRTTAWYEVGEDDIYVRPASKIGGEVLHDLLHELGHRYWFKFMTGASQKLWKERHLELARTAKSPSLPAVGEQMPFSFKRKGQKAVYPVVAKYVGKYVEFASGGMLTVDRLYNALIRHSKDLMYPSPYAATKVEEHFAEAFAGHVMGTLQPNHEEFFVATMLR